MASRAFVEFQENEPFEREGSTMLAAKDIFVADALLIDDESSADGDVIVVDLS